MSVSKRINGAQKLICREKECLHSANLIWATTWMSHGNKDVGNSVQRAKMKFKKNATEHALSCYRDHSAVLQSSERPGYLATAAKASRARSPPGAEPACLGVRPLASSKPSTDSAALPAAGRAGLKPAPHFSVEHSGASPACTWAEGASQNLLLKPPGSSPAQGQEPAAA